MARVRFLSVLAGLAVFSYGCECGQTEGEGTAPAAQPRTIAVIPKGTTHEFWKSVHAGANKAGRELGVEILWQGPVREDDRSEQIRVVEDVISHGVAGIVLAPLDDTALVPAAREATSEGIPVVIIDSGINWDGLVSFVATDNRRGGQLAAERLGEIMQGHGKAIMLRYQEGSASTMEREAGFLETMQQRFGDIELVSTNQYGGATTESAYATAENLLVNHPDVEGIFCPNESTTFGMLRALVDARRAGEVRFVGFDASEKLVEGLEAGHIQGLVVQNPFRMGELGVRAAIDHIDGRTVERRIDTGATMVTHENMAQPEIRELLAPDLARWLD